MIDALSTAGTLLKIANAIYRQAELVHGNQAQCLRLAERVQIITGSVNTLVHQQPQVTQQASYQDALLALQETLEDALALVTRYSDKSWFTRIVCADPYHAKFNALYARLEQTMQQLNLGLNIKQVLNAEQNQQDREKDHQALLANQRKVIEKIQGANQAIHQGNLDAEVRHDVMKKQLASIQYCLQQLAGQGITKKQTPIPEHLRVPFFDLKILQLITTGGFGKIYYGHYLEQEVAIKLLNRELTAQEHKEFLREVTIMQRLHSDYIVPLFAVCDEPGRTCLVMKYMAQGALRKVLDENNLTAIQKHQLIYDIALGLHYLHQQDVLHRDLNSSNVLVDNEGHARLADFGLSKRGRSNVSSLDKQSNALQWLPPEIVLGEGDKRIFTPQVDIYSYGILVWEILTGKRPFGNDSLVQFARKMGQGQREDIPDTLPPPYRQLIKQCWQEEPTERPAVTDIIQQLRKIKLQLRQPELAITQGVGQYARFWQMPSQDNEPLDPEVLYQAGISFQKEGQYEHAMICYHKASEKHHVKAKTNLALLYLKAPGTLKPDKVKAHQLLQQAAEAGHIRAMINLARQLKLGDGVPQDEQKAAFWQENATSKQFSRAKNSPEQPVELTFRNRA